ncbi:ATP-binding protein [Pseudodesulfovibrio sp.]|uniref:ATP-binding protein n=1 Tax=Pseudodesulfovibrio sp. TaxID=2035812 RepID=UPI00261DBF88|nr:ATP-binding protein [Pseudodesulfovibrio sp.]MDD3312444.1 ATP-binding protein [Pseudodesulfovibrio sp.]
MSNKRAKKNSGDRNDKPSLVPTMVAFHLIALIILATIGLVISRSLTRIGALATDTRDVVLPEVFVKQRTAVNLERLGRFAETVYQADDPRIRREYRLAARILTQDSVFGEPEVNRQVVDAYRDIEAVATLRDEQDNKRRQADILFLDFAPGGARLAPLLSLPHGGDMANTLFLASRARVIETLTALKAEFDQAAKASHAAGTARAALDQAGAYLDLRMQDLRIEKRCRLLWLHVNTTLEQVAGNLSVEAATTADSRFTAIAAEAGRAIHTGILAVAVLALAFGVFICFIHRVIVVPILRCVRGLDLIGKGERDITLPGARLRELHDINEAVERSGTLMAELADRTEAMRRANDALEQEIEARKKVQDDLARAKERAEAADRAKSDFLAGMSHEIRTPMNTILGMAELMLETSPTPLQQQYIEIFQASGEMLLGIINDVLDLSKIEAGEVVLENAPIDTRQFAERTREVVAGRVRQKGLAFTVDIGERVPSHFSGDPVRLRQVLVNLIDNGVKFTETGTVRLSIDRAESDPPGRMTFTVTDTGIGIPREVQGEIFNRFTQADASTTRKYGGTGLGLAICDRLVRLMGGSIHLESAPGRGSTFSFTLDFGAGETAAVAPRADSPSLERLTETLARTPVRLLVAEDSDSNQALIELYFSKTACSLDFASDGREAVEKFSSNEYDMVLMDIQMPVMDGYEATRSIRALERERRAAPTPVIAVTANAFREDQERCEAAGCTGYLAKPVSKRKLLESVARHAGGTR